MLYVVGRVGWMMCKWSDVIHVGGTLLCLHGSLLYIENYDVCD